MTQRGKHARRSGPGFYLDAAMLAAGIVLVGALVFGGLSWLAGRDGAPSEPTASESTTTTTGDTPSTSSTSSTSTSTTAAATTSPSPPTTADLPPTTIREAREPGSVRVVVLNSIGVPGLAAGLSDELASVGYQMSQPDNYSPELSDTMIFHAEGFSLEALDLSDAVPDGTVALNADIVSTWGADIVVVIGRSYQG